MACFLGRRPVAHARIWVSRLRGLAARTSPNYSVNGFLTGTAVESFLRASTFLDGGFAAGARCAGTHGAVVRLMNTSGAAVAAEDARVYDPARVVQTRLPFAVSLVIGETDAQLWRLDNLGMYVGRFPIPRHVAISRARGPGGSHVIRYCRVGTGAVTTH